MSRKSFILLIVVSICVEIFVKFADANDAETCALKQTCSDCIRSGCVWCSKNIPEGEIASRCTHKNKASLEWCPSESTVAFKSNFKLVHDDDLTAGDMKKDPVQIKPQHLKLSLVVGEKVEIPMFYQQAKDYPIDLYFMMDLSLSMKEHKTTLSLLGEKLATEMRNISNNFKLGFGSFVDKPEMPFTNTKPDQLKSPCDGCAPPYSFKHSLSLTEDSKLFSAKVKSEPLSGNLDNPEGGFDGLMQALVCKDQIGWRSKSRKLLIFSTDASPHIAGDGKLAGIVEPNDEECHLNDNGFYTHALAMDYPSISQIDYQARKNNINIIFATTTKEKPYYDLIKNSIDGASYGTLDKKSSNVIDLVKNGYNAIVNSITMMSNASRYVKIEFATDCSGVKAESTNKCTKLKGRPRVQFTVSITALDCPPDRSQWSQIVEIKPEALNESMRIELDIHCECPCEADERVEKKSEKCSRHGTLECGVCECDVGRYGKVCECDGDASYSASEDVSQCRPDNNTTTDVCSNKGSCTCNKCNCFAKPNPEHLIYGKYCECDNYSCKRNAGLLCSERGRCECGACVCESGWSGDACECMQNNATCIAPGSDKVCSGNGTCACGACRCDAADTFRYSGQFCEECPHCTAQRCDELRHCVECQVHAAGRYDADNCKVKCTAFQTVVVDKIDNDEPNESDDEKLCRVPDDAGCTIIFKYKYEQDQKVNVQGQKTKECSKDIDIIAVISGVVAAIVLGGLILLIIWKIMTSIHDSREYAKFINESQNAQFGGDNPLYKPSTTIFRNPTFDQ